MKRLNPPTLPANRVTGSRRNREDETRRKKSTETKCQNNQISKTLLYSYRDEYSTFRLS